MIAPFHNFCLIVLDPCSYGPKQIDELLVPSVMCYVRWLQIDKNSNTIVLPHLLLPTFRNLPLIHMEKKLWNTFRNSSFMLAAIILKFLSHIHILICKRNVKIINMLVFFSFFLYHQNLFSWSLQHHNKLQKSNFG